jgi:exodeoxyribonuclease VIII
VDSIHSQNTIQVREMVRAPRSTSNPKQPINPMTTPKPGIYDAVPFDEYVAWDAVSNSRLSRATRSPAHFNTPFGEPTAAMRLGSFVHCGVLETPLEIARRYVFLPDYANHPDNMTKSGERSFSSATTFVKTMEEQFRNLHHDKTIVPEEHFNKLVGISKAINQNATAKQLLRDGRSEVSIVWVDELSGLLCKMRADWISLTKERSIVLDLKTSLDALAFDKSIAKYGYHRQAAFYRRGVRAAFGVDSVPWLLAVETVEPFGNRVAPVDADAIAAGNSELDRLLATVAECKASGDWPGYSNPERWSLPAWYGRSEEPLELTIGDEVLSV